MITVDQIKSLVAEIKKITGLKQFEISKEAGYEPRTLGQLISKGVGLEEPYDQLKRVFGERLKNSPPVGINGNFTPEQLFAMFLEVTKAQTTILNNIESNMAREKTLADVGTNLNFVVASVKKISKIQDSGLKDLQGRLSVVQKSQSDLSRDVHSKLDQNGEDDKKQGNHP